MAVTTTRYDHIVVEEGVPWIADANMKVIELVRDHKAELDADIERRLRRVEQLQRESPPSPFGERLKRERQRLGKDGR